MLACLLAASVATAQESAPVSGPGGASSGVTGQKAPLSGEFRPSPQLNPTRIVALVPVVDVPGTDHAKAPLFLEDRESPETLAPGRLKPDASKAEVPAGIVSFRAMYSTDGQWALVDLQAREAVALDRVRKSLDSRVRIFTPAELANFEQASRVTLPAGLDLAQFLEP
jgi:hypothetical protein